MSDRLLKAGDVRKILGLTYRQLDEWEKKQERMKLGISRSGWRRFSIEDLIKFRIIQELLKMSLLLDKLIKWIRTMNLIDSVLIDFSNGKKVALYFNLTSFARIYVPELHRDLLPSILQSDEPVIFLPINKLIEEVLFTVSKKMSDFDLMVKRNNRGKYIYIIDKEHIVIPELPKDMISGEGNQHSIS